ncbi:MAG: phosphoribosyltransferase domain-containing protein [Oscillospiraceae bacterium]
MPITPAFFLAKRENNPNRDFIIINTLQAKHYPAKPSAAHEYMRRLGGRFGDNLRGRRTVVVAFSETATAVGTAVSEFFADCTLICTTREEYPYITQNCLEFEESHSHAKKHLLSLFRLNEIKSAEQIVIVDDEFTTGKTAVSLKNKLQPLVSSGCEFFAAAFIASEETRRNFSENGIALVTLSDHTVINRTIPDNFIPDRELSARSYDRVFTGAACAEIRAGVCAEEYIAECRAQCTRFADELLPLIKSGDSIEIIGTEEFCYPPIILGEMLEKSGADVEVHSVTRSPMLPCDKSSDYPIFSRARLISLYDDERTVYLYNTKPCAVSIIFTDARCPSQQAMERLCAAAGGERVFVLFYGGRSMKTSYCREDCDILLKDITGTMEPLPAAKREPLIQSGIHYSELLPAEYEPSPAYIREYENGLKLWAKPVADAVCAVSDEIMRRRNGRPVLVSIARAGTPVGVLIKRYIKTKYGVEAEHYSISLINGRGIDRCAMRYILARYAPQQIQFIDGWTGKGTILRTLREAVAALGVDISADLAVLADPAGLCEICGTHEDMFIPCSCLNSVVSGLFSRTVLYGDILDGSDYHGAAYFGELAAKDRTYQFIEAIEREMTFEESVLPAPANGEGYAEAQELARKFRVSSIGLVKPGIGETTRVLLRRIPELILVRDFNSPLTRHLIELAREKGVEVREYPLRYYHSCGIIKAMSDV